MHMKERMVTEYQNHMWMMLLLLSIFGCFLETHCLSPPTLMDLLNKTEWNDGHGYNRYRADQWNEDSSGDNVVVEVGIYVLSLTNINAATMAFHADMYIQQAWNDTRLAHNESRYLAVSDGDIIHRIWRPDLYFGNSKKTEYHKLTKPNNLMRIYPNGRVYFAIRVSGQFICNLQLHMYPYDNQECGIEVGSFSYTTNELQFRWFPLKPVQTNPAINLPEMYITGTKKGECTDEFTSQGAKNFQEEKDKKMQYSCLVASIMVQRSLGYHIVQTYIPSMLIVSISWVSFWIDPHAAPARATLSVTTLLTLTTQTAGIRMTLPNVSYAKAIDLWMGFCTLMVFATLLEYAVVNSMVQKSSHLLRIKTHEKAKKRSRRKTGANNFEDNNFAVTATVDTDEEIKWKKTAYQMERLSRIMFPAFFFFVTFIYWLVLLTW